MPEPFALEPSDRPAQLLRVLANDVIAEGAICSPRVPFVANLRRKIEDDRDRKHVVPLRQGDQRRAGALIRLCLKALVQIESGRARPLL